ncbi:MAG: hypothetical protein HZC36_08460 [Armatimonadetes bacterium]|nr:hypothetical protein [Armatimonadota bacterium]
MAKAKTTLLIEEDLIYRAKKIALERRMTLTMVVEEALKSSLHAAKQPPKRKKIKLPTYDLGGLLPGVDLENREQIEELMGNSGYAPF